MATRGPIPELENDLSGQGRTGPSVSQSHGEHVCPPARSSRAHPAWERLAEAQSPARAWDRRAFGILRRAGGSPKRAQVNTAVRSSSGEGTSPSAPQAVVWELPKGPLPEPGEGLRGCPSLPHPDPTPRAPRPSSSTRLLPTPALGVSLPPPASSSPRPGKVWIRRRARSPALTLRGAEPRRPARVRTEGGGASAELLTAALAVPAARQAGKGEEAARVSPAGSPTQRRDATRRRPQPARLRRLRGRQVPARGWWEGPPPARPEGAAGRGARVTPPPPGSAPLPRALGAWPGTGDCWPLWDIGCDRKTNYISF